MSVGEDLKWARILRHVSQYELAARLGIPAPKLSEIEHGKRQVNPEMAKKIEEAIDELAREREARDEEKVTFGR